jgi:hypothetical protein
VLSVQNLERPGAFSLAVPKSAAKAYVEAAVDEDGDGRPGPLDPQGQADRYPVIMTARFRAKIPRDTGLIEVVYPATLGPVITNLRRGMDSQVLMTLAPGEKGSFKIGEIHFTLGGFLREGFTHVCPEGWDHCLFMLTMMLAASSVGEALKRSLIFTLGHAITLSLVVTGLLPTVGPWIEPVIAATIALGGYLAYRQKPARIAFMLVPLAFGLIHGKAGVLRRADGTATAFLGSVNESASAWKVNYELLWEDDSPETIDWVQEEFDALWNDPRAIDLACCPFIAQDLQRIISRKVIEPAELKGIDDPTQVAASAAIETPVYRREQGLWPHQKYFARF